MRNKPATSVCSLRIQPSVTGKRILRRLVFAVVLAIGIFALFGALNADATPIRPDIRKLLEQAPDANPQFVPARAGWDGPEAAKTPSSPPNPVMEKFSPAGSARAIRASLIAAATPDWRIALGLFALILLWRKFRNRHNASSAPPIVTQSTELDRAA